MLQKNIKIQSINMCSTEEENLVVQLRELKARWNDSVFCVRAVSFSQTKVAIGITALPQK